MHPEEGNHCLTSHRLVKLTLVSPPPRPPISLLMPDPRQPSSCSGTESSVLFSENSSLSWKPVLASPKFSDACCLHNQPSKDLISLPIIRFALDFIIWSQDLLPGIFCLLFFAQVSVNGSLICFPELNKQTTKKPLIASSWTLWNKNVCIFPFLSKWIREPLGFPFNLTGREMLG